MSDSTPEELAEKLWFPLDDPRSDGGIADGLGIANRLAIKELGRQARWLHLPRLRLQMFDKNLVHALIGRKDPDRSPAQSSLNRELVKLGLAKSGLTKCRSTKFRLTNFRLTNLGLTIFGLTIFGLTIFGLTNLGLTRGHGSALLDLR